MIRVILESSVAELAVVGRAGNEAFLCQSDKSRFPLLSQVDNVSYAVFGRSDMPQLVVELNSVAPKNGDHVAEIISLATRCRDEAGTILTFTPFTD